MIVIIIVHTIVKENNNLRVKHIRGGGALNKTRNNKTNLITANVLLTRIKTNLHGCVKYHNRQPTQYTQYTYKYNNGRIFYLKHEPTANELSPNFTVQHKVLSWEIHRSCETSPFQINTNLILSPHKI